MIETQILNNIEINTHIPPKVLFVGNGLVKSKDGMSWDKLLCSISDSDNLDSCKGIPYAMQPEALCGTDVEQIQVRIAEKIKDSTDSKTLEKMLELPFDAIITTNYTYEIETILSGGIWNESRRRKSLSFLDGSCHVLHNTFLCNLVKAKDGREIPVFHIHGERSRKHSMILSYYSYANAVSRLVAYNKTAGNKYAEHQENDEMLIAKCWLDYFLLGEVYAVGFGFDTSEFDVWWAIERKSREKAMHGDLHTYITLKPEEVFGQKNLLEKMGAEVITELIDKDDYSSAYERIFQKLKNQMQ